MLTTIRIFILSLLLLISACSEQPEVHQYRFSGPIMGTQYTVKVLVDVPLSEANEAEIDKAILAELAQVDRLMSTYKADSEVSRFNLAPVGTQLPISSQTYEVIQAATTVHARSNGAFDMTVGPLVELWGFGADPSKSRVPDAAAIEKVKAQLAGQRFKLEPNSITKFAELSIDLSALAKGYAVDQVAAMLKARTFRNYMVEVGGELVVAGNNASGGPWRLGVEMPDALAQQAVNVVTMTQGALATSGDYRNYFESGGKRYSHTIDPKTGYPIEHKLASVSVLAQSCMQADAWATALMVLGEQDGLALAQAQGLDAMFIYRKPDGFGLSYSGNFKSYVQQLAH